VWQRKNEEKNKLKGKNNPASHARDNADHDVNFIFSSTDGNAYPFIQVPIGIEFT
jgi:hypothetical protein